MTWNHGNICRTLTSRVELDDILIVMGADNPKMFITEQVRTGGVEKPWGFKYKLGWALMGPTNKLRTSQVDVNLLQRSNAAMDEKVFKDEVKQFFHNDGLGVVTSIKSCVMKISRWKKILETSARVTDGHYKIGMLWKVQNTQLLNNQEVGLKRFQYLKTRLKQDKDLNEKYQAKVQQYIKRGNASKLRPE